MKKITKYLYEEGDKVKFSYGTYTYLGKKLWVEDASGDIYSGVDTAEVQGDREPVLKLKFIAEGWVIKHAYETINVF